MLAGHLTSQGHEKDRQEQEEKAHFEEEFLRRAELSDF